MEKGTPHCKLRIVKAKLALGAVRITTSAMLDGARLGFAAGQIIEVVQRLTVKDFYKSMTTYQDHTVWQDVYHADTQAGMMYLKLTVIEDVLIVSFKEKQS